MVRRLLCMGGLFVATAGVAPHRGGTLFLTDREAALSGRA